VTAPAPANPLLRFTGGGWRKGMLRLALGVGIVAMVLWFQGKGALERLLDPAVIPFLATGAIVHLTQRGARILKWWRMLDSTEVVQHRWTVLLRIQLIGMLANLVLPVSEALKVWAVARDRRQMMVASKSIVVETALHALMMGVAGTVALAMVGGAAPWLAWLAALAMVALPALTIALLRWRRGDAAARPVRLDGTVAAWCAVETTCQVMTYAIAFAALDVAVGAAQLVALSPILFLTDLAVLTPSGLGARELLFGVALTTLGHTANSDVAVAVGLLVSSMLLLATVVGAGLALVLPGDVMPAPPADESA
jgi:hypothetical protein